jgi:hypothetical protein
MNLENPNQSLSPCPDCRHPCSPEAAACPNCGKPLGIHIAEHRERDGSNDRILGQILTNSSMKIGMCLTLLGLIRVQEGLKKVVSMADQLLAVNAVGFLISSMFSYLALKQRSDGRREKQTKTADLAFTLSLGLLVGICVVFAIELF